MPEATFLYRPPVGDLHAALDVVFKRPRYGRGGTVFKRRVALLTQSGEWALRAREGQFLARQRAFDAQVIQVGGANAGAALKIVRHPLDAVITVAPFRRAVKWFAQAHTRSRTPWILATADLASGIEVARPYTVAVTAPWSPTSGGGDPVFPPMDFATTYEAVYDRPPSSDAASGAALGALLTQLVAVARSTDPSRLIRARDALKSGSLWGPLSFRHGEQAAFSPYVVLLDRGKTVNIWPPPGKIEALRFSVPPAASR
jgi:hypothetical protein